MASYSISAKPSGSSKDNAASRNLSTVFPYTNGTYKTISYISRKNGVWCSSGGSSQSVTLTGYDQLINTATGTVIKTSSTGTCKCHGTGPASENYMTTVFSDWTQAESNAAIAAWAAGTLQIKRTVSIKSYTSSGHGTPYFRDGYYVDTITIQGSTLPFTDYRPAIVSFTAMRSTDGLTETQLSTSVYAKIHLSMNDTSGLTDNPKLYVQWSTNADFENPSTITLGTTQSAIQKYLSLSVVKLSGTYSIGTNYYFRLMFTAGEEIATPWETVVGMAYVPFHIPGNNSGIAFGMYSNSTENNQRMECAYPAYLYGGIEQIGDDWVELTPATGTTPAEFGGGALRCRAIEKKRIIAGSIQVTPGSETVVLATLPNGYTPTSGVFSLNACTGARVARIAIGGKGEANEGKLGLSWVRNLSDGALYTSSVWVQCSIEYWVD